MEFKLTINMDNAAFEDNEDELARILLKLATELRDERDISVGNILMDSNGNHVGHAWVEETETSSVYAKEG
jgi:hypothetical protein